MTKGPCRAAWPFVGQLRSGIGLCTIVHSIRRTMEVFKTRWFARFAQHERIADASLRDSIARAERGLIDADLGGGLIKAARRPTRPRTVGRVSRDHCLSCCKQGVFSTWLCKEQPGKYR